MPEQPEPDITPTETAPEPVPAVEPPQPVEQPMVDATETPFGMPLGGEEGKSLDHHGEKR